jgi:chromosome segregation ATPase
MIEKIKALGRVGEDVSIIKKEIKAFRKNVDELRGTLDMFHSEINRMKESQIKNCDIIDETRKSVQDIHILAEDFKKEIYDFKIMKTQMQKEIMQRFESELQSELRTQIGNLKDTQERYETLKNNVSIVSQNVTVLMDEVIRFKEIAKYIKDSDFHLNKYYRNLEESDKEKIRLLKKIDNLERMVAKMRRSR